MTSAPTEPDRIYLALAPYRQAEDDLARERRALELVYWPMVHRALLDHDVAKAHRTVQNCPCPVLRAFANDTLRQVGKGAAIPESGEANAEAYDTAVTAFTAQAKHCEDTQRIALKAATDAVSDILATLGPDFARLAARRAGNPFVAHFCDALLQRPKPAESSSAMSIVHPEP